MAYKTLSKTTCTGLEKRPGCIQASLDILGDKWSPLLLGQLVAHGKTFGELEVSLAGISPRTLSSRLDKLQDNEVIDKSPYCEHPKRYRYSLTSKGRELQDILSKMARWGEHYA